MKFKILLCILIVSSSIIIFPQSDVKKLNITYIANEGFLLSTPNKKVIIDALFKEGYGFFLTPPKTLEDSIINAIPPFNNINLFLLTHHHADHCDPGMITDFLDKQKNVPLVCSEPAWDFIQEKSPISARLKDQIVEVTPPMNRSISKVINGIPVKIFSLKHLSYYKNGVDLDSGMFNISFLFDMDGIKVFHSGDIMKNALQDYMVENKEWKDTIDVAFLYYEVLDSSKSDPDYVIKMLNPKYIVLMHIPPVFIAAWAKKIDQLKMNYPGIIFFVNPMDSRTLTFME
jgi:L-ascorbate metabolism protein UlaG (beta-lactamase superfamily)